MCSWGVPMVFFTEIVSFSGSLFPLLRFFCSFFIWKIVFHYFHFSSGGQSEFVDLGFLENRTYTELPIIQFTQVWHETGCLLHLTAHVWWVRVRARYFVSPCYRWSSAIQTKSMPIFTFESWVSCCCGCITKRTLLLCCWRRTFISFGRNATGLFRCSDEILKSNIPLLIHVHTPSLETYLKVISQFMFFSVVM